MTISDLIFSNRNRERVSRHMLFLAGYSWLFHFQNDNRTLLYAASFLPSCILAVYGVIYFLLPFLKKKKYGRFALGMCGLYLVTLMLDVFGSYLFFTDWDWPVSNKMIVGLAIHNHVIAMFMGGVALGIKATKNWYIRHQENLELEKQKVRRELSLERANLYPEFILQTLASLQVKIANGANESPAFLLKLSDTLSYILYDSQDDLIVLDKELNMVRNIVDLKKMNCAAISFIHLSVNGDCERKYIAPLTIFRLTQNLLQIMTNDEKVLTEVNIKIEIEDDSLFFRLIGTYSFEQDMVHYWQTLLTKIRNQLKGIYPDAYELKVAEDENAFSLSLRQGITLAGTRIQTSKNAEYVLA